MTTIMTLFKVIIIVQLFYAFAITSIAYAIPEDARNQVTAFSDLADEINLKNVSSQVQTSIESQTQLPAIELGALVFYSGNILIDLLLNFTFAIPEMIALLINGILRIFNLDTTVVATVQLFFSVLVIVMYFISIAQLLIGIRSGRGVV